MVDEYDDKNRFVLFKNTDKAGNESRPDYTGNITLEDGKELRLAAWMKESKNGLKFLSGAVSEKMENQQAKTSDQSSESEEVPF